MTEHPAWWPIEDGCQRVFILAGSTSVVTVQRGHCAVQSLSRGTAVPAFDRFRGAKNSPRQVPQLASALLALGPVVRFRNPSLWDAVGTAILRQVIRAGHSRRMYRSFCTAYGQRIDTPHGVCWLFPEPTIVARLSAGQFRSLGMSFKGEVLQAAAKAYLKHGLRWAQLPAPTLIDELQKVRRIGPWTARAAVADWSNDWALYPFEDMAVRKWARRAAPSFPWPNHEQSFAAKWATITGDDLSSVTLLTLAWGSQYGDIG